MSEGVLHADQIIVGGVYALKRSNGGYQVWLVVALDPIDCHVAFYDEEFTELPTREVIRDLTPDPTYAYMSRSSWLQGKIQYVGVVGVKDHDLAGYYEHMRFGTE